MASTLPINIPNSHYSRLNEKENFLDEKNLLEPLTRSYSYPPSIYHPPKFYSPPTQRKYQQGKLLRKCAYIVAIVEPELFISAGAKAIYSDIYFLPRTYDGTCAGETCAVIGIGKKYIRELFNKNNDIYSLLKICPELKDVPGIEDLSPYKLGSLRCMLKFLYFMHDRELILFNIEPKGSEGNERRYPCANICLPGGGMEFQDEYDWNTCASREFKEETGLILPKFNSIDIKVIAQQRFNFPDRQGQYIWIKCKKFEKANIEEKI